MSLCRYIAHLEIVSEPSQNISQKCRYKKIGTCLAPSTCPHDVGFFNEGMIIKFTKIQNQYLLPILYVVSLSELAADDITKSV
jgi:hypothetical protein